MSIPCTLGDPAPLRDALVHIVGHNAEITARLEPAVRMTVERPGRFGRTRTEELPASLECAHFADEHGEGHYEITVAHPAGWPGLLTGPPAPVGARLTQVTEEYFTVDLALAASPTQAAVEVAGLAVLVFGEAMGTAWHIEIVDNT